MSASGARRPVIGLLINSFFDGYEEAVWRGVADAAAEADVDLLCFLVGALGYDRSADELFDVVDAENVDGVIVTAGSLAWACGPDAVAARLARLGPMPKVSFSDPVGGPRVLADNAGGIALLVEHLVQAHGRRRIAFLAGPATNTEAQARLAGYREALERLGLPFDPALVLAGDFTRASAREAFRRLDQQPVELDAVLAANDAMALAALEELRRRGRRVPDDVAVCGFDDIADAASSDPLLTTARQPIAEMAREAVRQLLALVRGGSAPPDTVFPARMVVRQSCGCSRLGAAVPAPDRALATGAPAALAAALEREFPDLAARAGAPSWAGQLASALYEALGAGDRRPFLATVEQLLSGGLRRVPGIDNWLRVLRVLIAWARQVVPAGQRELLAELHADANALLASIGAGLEQARRVKSEAQARSFRWLAYPFPLDERRFLESLLEQLEALRIRSVFVSRFVDPGRGRAALVGHYDRDGVAALEEPPAVFAPRRLIPGRFTGRRRRAHAVLPVGSPDGLIGFALCELGPMPLHGYEMVMHELSMVLSVHGLMAEVRDQERQLLETARQAGMAEVAVGALHNIGNLLTSVSVSAEEIRAAAADVGGAGLSRGVALLREHEADLPRFLAEDPRGRQLPAYLSEVAQALTGELHTIQAEAQELVERTGLVRESIRALQDHARGGHDHALRETVELATLVHVALEIQRGNLDRHRVQVQVDVDRVPPFVAPRSKLVHVLVNLVKNGVEAMRSTPEQERRLTLTARQEEGRIRLDVADSGEGIAAENLDRIFTYGFTTKRDGHGFGLHTCANAMKQMGGALTVRSDGRGRGATFTLTVDPRGERS